MTPHTGPENSPPSPTGPRRPRRAIVEWTSLSLLIAAGVLAWGLGIVARDYDHDEGQRAHSGWLVPRGLRPYSELFEVHPPYFVLLTPILARFPEPCSFLRALRVFSAVGNFAFLLALIALGRGGVGMRWALLGVACVAFH